VTVEVRVQPFLPLFQAGGARSGLRRHGVIDLGEDALPLAAEHVLESLEVALRVDDGLKFLEGELIALEHELDRVLVQPDFVLLEEVDELVQI